MGEMSGDYYLDNSSAFISVHKKTDFGCSGLANLQFRLISCGAEFVYLYAGLHTRAYLNFTFKPPISITFLKSCQNYLVPRNQLWDYRLLPLDQIHSGLFLMGGICLGFFYLPGTENPYISKLNHNFSLTCIFYFANTCGFHAVNILSLESLK